MVALIDLKPQESAYLSESKPQVSPFLKWAGGKGKLLAQYEQFFPGKFENYYEPFLGGGAVFFHLHPRIQRQAILSDVNIEIINLYRCIRDNVEEVIKHLSTHQQRHNKEYYYTIRKKRFRKAEAQAARTLYLNKTCWNGLYRRNRKGEFNVPMGKYKNPVICNVKLLRAVSKILQPVRIEVADFSHLLNSATPKDFIYFDPPYKALSSTSCFTGYHEQGFGTEDQERLRDLFVELAQKGVKVMLSNSDCAYIRELYRGFNIHQVLAARAINSKGNKRGKITELVITSY